MTGACGPALSWIETQQVPAKGHGMAFPTAVNSQITDAVAQPKTKGKKAKKAKKAKTAGKVKKAEKKK